MLPVARVRVPSMVASSATVRSSVDVNCSADTIAEAVTLPVTVWAPDANVPLVLKFSLSNDIVPPESVMEPSARVRLPTVEPVARVAVPLDNVPVVDRFSSPNDIEPPESVIKPSLILTVPTPALDPVRVVNVPATGAVPPIMVLLMVPPDIVKSSAT